MRRIICIFAVFALLFTSGCTNLFPAPATEPQASVEPTDPTPTDIQEPTTPPSTTPHIPFVEELICVSIPATSKIEYADNGTELFRYTYQNLSLTLPESEIADKIIIDFLNRLDVTSKNAQDVFQLAKSNYRGSNNWTPYFLQSIYSPTRIDRSVLSLFGKTVRFTGSSHPEQACMAANYDLLTGNVLTLGSILAHADDILDLQDLVIQQLAEMKDTHYLYSDYAEVVRQRFSRDESQDEDWFFTDAGLGFFFSPYEVAPYSSGPITVEIPYSDLNNILDDNFFPSEREETIGSLSCIPFEDADLTAFSRFAESIVTKSSMMSLITTNSSVQDIRIRMVDPISQEEYVFFASYALSAMEGIMLEASQEDLQNMTLSYTSNGQINHQTITLP